MKNILIIGLGRFGRHCAKKLTELGHQVMAVDVREDRVDTVLPYVTDGLIGNSTKADFPILIFNSGKDDMTPPNMGKDLAASFKGEGKHLVVFDDCGHMDGLKKHPDEYKEAVKDLLDEVK